MKSTFRRFVVFKLCFLSLSTATTIATETDVRCGSRCLFVALKSLDIPIASTLRLEESLGNPFPGGYTMAQLAKAAEEQGAKTLGVKTSFENLQRRKDRFACIAFIHGNHFVLFGNVKDGLVLLVDPPKSETVPLLTLQPLWQGEALLISSDEIASEESLAIRGHHWPYLVSVGFVAIGLIAWVWRWRHRTL